MIKIAGEYKPPGVYAQEEILGISPSPIANDDIVALVSEVSDNAPGVESLVLTGTTPVNLAKQGIVSNSVRVFSRDEFVEYATGTDFLVTSSGPVDYNATKSITRNVNNVAGEAFTLDSGLGTYTPRFNRGVHNLVVKTVVPAKTYVEYVDYVYDKYTGTLRSLSGGTLPRNGTSITIDYDYGIASGESVIVRYGYSDGSYYAPQLFEDAREVFKTYGSPWRYEVQNGATVVKENSMSLAASLVFSNGGPATQVMCVPVNPHAIDPAKTTPTLAEWEVAFNSITQDEVTLVVESSGEIAKHGKLITTVLGASVYQQSRIGLLGRDGIKDGSSRAELRSYAQALNNQRIVLTSPTKLIVQDTLTGAAREVGGQYGAAALAGRLTLFNRQDTMTRKSLVDIRLDKTESDLTLTQDSATGLCVLENKSGFMRIRHGLTTMFSDINQREISIIRAKDFLIKSMREALDGSVIGMLMTPDVDFLIQGVAINILDRMVNSYLITGYQSPQVIQDTSDPTRMRLIFTYTPNYPVNEIVIEFGITPIGTSVVQ